MKLLHALWRDEAGFVITSELLIIVTVAVFGLIVGYVAVRDALVQELCDVAAAIGSLDQTYSYNGISNTGPGTEFTNGSSFSDASDAGDLTTSQSGASAGAIIVNVAPSGTGG